MSISADQFHTLLEPKAEIWLNHAAKSPMLKIVKSAFESFYQERTVGDIIFVDQGIENRQNLFRFIASLIGVNPSRMSTAENTSSALNLLGDNLSFESGDEIVVFRDEFPANYFPYKRLESRGVILREVLAGDNGLYCIQDFLDFINPRTKLLSISDVQFSTGQKAPLEELSKACHSVGAYIVVDGIQAVGAIPTDYQACDFVAFAEHKWLMMPQGNGFFAYSERMQEAFLDHQHGWLDRPEPFDFSNKELNKVKGSERFLLGTPNDLTIHLALAVAQLRDNIGESLIQEKCMHAGRYLRENLSRLGLTALEKSGPMVVCDIPNQDALIELCLKANIATTIRGGRMRISPHFYTPKEDLDKLLNVLDDHMKREA